MAAVAAQAQSYEHFQDNLKEAKAGNRLAQYNVGLYYHKGWSGVKQDYQQAAYWFRKSADQGVPEAQVNLGYFYENGLGVAQSSQQAVYWYRKAAEQGYGTAMHRLGNCYYEGEGVAQDFDEAYRLAVEALEESDASDAIAPLYNLLAVCYYHGRGVAKDEEKAEELYKLAISYGSLDARANLGSIYGSPAKFRVNILS